MTIANIRGEIQEAFPNGKDEAQIVIDRHGRRFQRLVNRFSIVHVYSESIVPSLGEVKLVVQVIGLVVAVERDGAKQLVVTHAVVDLLGVGYGVGGEVERIALVDRLLSHVIEVIEIDTQGGVFTDGKQCVQINKVRLVIQIAVGAEQRRAGLLDAQLLT